MADELSMAVAELLRKAGIEQGDWLREGVRVWAEALMQMELEQHLGAERHERTPERTGYRNGTRERTWDTRVGTIELQVPRVRDGSFFPSLLEAAATSGTGAGGCRPGGVRAGRLDAPGGRP